MPQFGKQYFSRVIPLGGNNALLETSRVKLAITVTHQKNNFTFALSEKFAHPCFTHASYSCITTPCRRALNRDLKKEEFDLKKKLSGSPIRETYRKVLQ